MALSAGADAGAAASVSDGASEGSLPSATTLSCAMSRVALVTKLPEKAAVADNANAQPPSAVRSGASADDGRCASASGRRFTARLSSSGGGGDAEEGRFAEGSGGGGRRGESASAEADGGEQRPALRVHQEFALARTPPTDAEAMT